MTAILSHSPSPTPQRPTNHHLLPLVACYPSYIFHMALSSGEKHVHKRRGTRHKRRGTRHNLYRYKRTSPWWGSEKVASLETSPPDRPEKLVPQCLTFVSLCAVRGWVGGWGLPTLPPHWSGDNIQYLGVDKVTSHRHNMVKQRQCWVNASWVCEK